MHYYGEHLHLEIDWNSNYYYRYDKKYSLIRLHTNLNGRFCVLSSVGASFRLQFLNSIQFDILSISMAITFLAHNLHRTIYRMFLRF